MIQDPPSPTRSGQAPTEDGAPALILVFSRFLSFELSTFDSELSFFPFGILTPRHSTASTSLLRSLCGNSVISVAKPSSFRFLSFELSTGHPVKDAHPERAPRVEGSLWPSRNSNHSRTYESFSRNPNHSRTYAKHGGGGAFCKMSSPITLLFSFTMLTSLSITIVGAPTFPLLHAKRRRAARLRRTGPTQEGGTQEKAPASESGRYTRKRNPRPTLTKRGWGTRPREKSRGCRFRNAGATRLPLFARLHL